MPLSQYNFAIKLTASNLYMTSQETIYLTLLNTANYIYYTTSYNRSSSNFTSGSIYVSENFQNYLPLEAFSGNDLDFALALNGSTSNIIPATEQCVSPAVQFCVENKTFEFQTIPYTMNDFDVFENLLVFTNSENITVYNVTTNSYLFFSVFEVNSCYFVRFIPGVEYFVVSCTNNTGA